MATSTNARRRNAPPAAEETAPRRRRSASKVKRLLRTILLILIIIAASVGATLYYTWPAGADLLGLSALANDDTQEGTEATASTSTKEKETPPPAPSDAPIFSQLDPFTVTIRDDSNHSRILHVAITLQVSDEDSAKLLKEYNPVVRDRVLTILSEQNSNYIQTPEGREQLVDSLTEALGVAYGRSHHTEPRIDNLLFTAFVIQ